MCEKIRFAIEGGPAEFTTIVVGGTRIIPRFYRGVVAVREQ